MPQKTLADTLAARETIYVNCAHPMCCKSTKLDIQALIDRLGRDHGSMHDDLVGLFVCSNCKAAGSIYLELHPETASVTERGGPGRGKTTDNLSTVSFADATAALTGADARTVRRDAERGEKVIDEVINLIRDTKFDTGTYLDKLKKLSPNDQVAAAKRDLAFARPPASVLHMHSRLRRPAAGAQSRLEANFRTNGLKVTGAAWRALARTPVS